MAIQTVFQRYEMKYLLTPDQKEAVLRAMQPYMEPDRYGRTSIRNLYYDTDNYRLIRRSIERPVYKEKLRVRSYGRAEPDGVVFAELKKKYKHTVYKRRLLLRAQEAADWLAGRRSCPVRTQIAAEIDYFVSYYETLHPVVFLSYEREAFAAKDGGVFRVTFDENILCRQEELTLDSEAYGAPVLEPGLVLMELKCAGGIPLWMTHTLSGERIYKTSFSKYGTAYQNILFPAQKEAVVYA
ncbi:MAG: polyphosphate polymerase domain-containing protein [Clostridiales bacterium]|nr:polyphosphate polymerase domain-containing protein [Clostridiales bacterium]PWL48048.1 MAG: molecular chaperone [Clostridiales bacterium]